MSLKRYIKKQGKNMIAFVQNYSKKDTGFKRVIVSDPVFDVEVDVQAEVDRLMGYLGQLSGPLVLDNLSVGDVAGMSAIDDWYLPTSTELIEMKEVLHWRGLGNFQDENYWTSNNYGLGFTNAYAADFSVSDQKWLLNVQLKSENLNIRALRRFTLGPEEEPSYAPLDTGPAGGWIIFVGAHGLDSFYYYEAAPEDLVPNIWSNVDDSYVNASAGWWNGGIANTAAIIAQEGHTNSAAKSCDDWNSLEGIIPTSITVEVSGGLGDKTYELYLVIGEDEILIRSNNTGVFNNLNVGEYVIVVEDEFENTLRVEDIEVIFNPEI